MKFSLALSAEPPEQSIALAQAAEAAGFNAITLSDSLCFPKSTTSKYPYNEDGSNSFIEDLPFIDPFVQIARLSSITKKLQFTTAVVKLAVRQPVVVAKMLSSLAVITDNRVSFGVGLSPWEEDFAACQIPWSKRGQRMDEMIESLRGLLSGEWFGYEGTQFSIPEVKLCPSPTQPVPILLGGHSEPALKRAARIGDGWVGAGSDLDSLQQQINKLNELRKDYGRDHLPFAIHTTGGDAFNHQGITTLKEIGVDLVYLGFHDIYSGKPDTRTLDEKITAIDWYGREFIEPHCG